jgi:hypothetical protein
MYGKRGLLPAPSARPGRLAAPKGQAPGGANARPVNSLLTAHLWLGAVVAALAVLFVWQLRGRRITLYVVTLQIALGVVLMVQGLRVPWYHYALAILGWAGYMAANALARREGRARQALIVTAVSSLLILIAFAVGQHAVKALGGG